jgi:hypothetical protein
MTLQDMLCNVQQFSPTKLKGLLLPSRGNSTGQRTPIKCEPLPEPAVFRYQQLVFKPVKIPVVFHCKYTDASHSGKLNNLVVVTGACGSGTLCVQAAVLHEPQVAPDAKAVLGHPSLLSPPPLSLSLSLSL